MRCELMQPRFRLRARRRLDGRNGKFVKQMMAEQGRRGFSLNSGAFDFEIFESPFNTFE